MTAASGVTERKVRPECEMTAGLRGGPGSPMSGLLSGDQPGFQLIELLLGQQAAIEQRGQPG